MSETTLADNQKEITVAGQKFIFTERYAAGHVITENEAKALNQVLSENIRNNVAAKVKDESIEFTQADFDEYASGYEFSANSVRRKPVDPLEKEAISIAKKKIAEMLRDKGTTVKDFTATEEGAAKYQAAIDNLVANEQVLKLAKARVAEREQLAAIKI